VVDRQPIGPSGRWRVERVTDGLILWTVPAASPSEPVTEGCALLPGHPRIDIGRHGFVRVAGNEVVVASDTEVRGYRGSSREVK
jgi:hypothetical protein